MYPLIPCAGNWVRRTVFYPASLIITETFIDQSQAKFCCHQSVHQPVPIGWMHLLIQIFLSSFFFLGDENTAKRVPPLHRRLKNILGLVREVVWTRQLQAAGWLASETGLKSAESFAWLKPEKLESGTEVDLHVSPFNIRPYLRHSFSGIRE